MADADVIDEAPVQLYETISFEDLPVLLEYLPPRLNLAWYGGPGIGKSQMSKHHPDLQPVTIVGLATRQAEDIGGCPYPDAELEATLIYPMVWFKKYSLRVEDYLYCRHCGGPVAVEIADNKRSGVIRCISTKDDFGDETDPAGCVQKTAPIQLPTGTLIFDEFDKGTPEKQVAVMRILSERELEGYELSPLVRIIVISNREEDDTGVFYEMPNVTKNRLIHIGVAPDFEQWQRDFAIPQGLHPLVLAFLKENLEYFVTFKPNERQFGFCTPRSWEYASDILQAVDAGLPRELGRKAIIGAIGSEVGELLWKMKEFVDACPPIADLANGTDDFPPADRPDKWIALVTRCVAASESGLRRVQKDLRVLQQVCQVLARIPDTAAIYRLQLGTWLRRRPLTRELIIDTQAMGTADHMDHLGDDMADLQRPKRAANPNSWAG